MATLSFLGAVETVTGSRYLVQGARGRVLVDCGLFQGPKKLRERNWTELPFDVAGLDAVVLTHAHIDHSGYLPRLCREFAGPIYCTPGTAALLRLLLPDAGHLQEEEAHHANKWGYARHHPALPLYTRADAEHCLEQLQRRDVRAPFEPAPGFVASFTRAGHIIGSACVRLVVDDHAIGFTATSGGRTIRSWLPPSPSPRSIPWSSSRPTETAATRARTSRPRSRR